MTSNAEDTTVKTGENTAQEAPNVSQTTDQNGQEANSDAQNSISDAANILDEDVPSYVSKSKKRYVIMFGYSGIGYKGLQIQPEVKTIEGTLEDAICKTGVVKKENMGDLRKSGWSRAARTDKGVHALGQIVSLRMAIEPSEPEIESFRAALNKELPDDIHVFGILRTVKSFNSKNACSGRKYEYLIPTFMLTAPNELLEEAQKLDVRPDEEKEAKNDSSNNDEDAVAPEYLLKQSELLRSKSPAMDDATHKRLSDALQCYVGTKYFHNFTPRMAGDDPRAQRYIKEITLDKPFQVEGIDVVRVNIEGQSFMLNQIRLMIAAAIEVTRRGLDAEKVIGDLLDREKAFSFVMAPGEGLALRACLYEYYNKKYGSDYAEGCAAASNMYESIQFEEGPIAEEVEEFRAKQIYPVIANQELKNCVFTDWLLSSTSRTFPPNLKSARNYEDYKEKLETNKREFVEKRIAEKKRTNNTSVQALEDEIMGFCNSKRNNRG
eukprot:CAMPEP_0171485472 /NCGR_PEP_ID=MMETSP0958-20121227/563_1 /TAXON_ID=87120 /ORGANISM="Aurantiochytrium limacinum, Strain ATCCMYA-1381" /LENGTH=492 /DNA_ID=CAMNT_0012018263 /DNA_START=158 /DNA_END=1636 /DNA_ORIENTATION=+